MTKLGDAAVSFLLVLATVIISSPLAAGQIMALQEGNSSKCTQTVETRDETAKKSERIVITREFQAARHSLSACISVQGTVMLLDYPVNDGKIGKYTRYDILGQSYENASAYDKKRVKIFLDSIPVFEIMFTGRQINTGDLIFEPAIADWMISYVRAIDGGAQMGKPRNEVRATRLETLRGRPTIVANGILSMDFYVRGNSFVITVDGDYYIDAQSGLAAGWRTKSSISYAHGTLFRYEDEATCAVEGGTAEPVIVHPTPPVGPVPAGAEKPTPSEPRAIRERLESLDRLLKDGLITPEDAAKKREEILRAL